MESSTQWKAVQVAFDQISILSGKQREEALLQLEKNDPVVHQEVNALLGEELRMHNIFGNNPFGDFNFFEDEGLLNSKIGPYRLVELLGYGGMGSVFLADRIDEEFEQKVAMKLVRPRKYTAATINRFREERQILSSLNHPNIGRFYDGGSMEDGRMYFTMEYLPWTNLQEYIEEKKPTLSQRLALFKGVASGIAYAHSQMVLHLDIKPKNILVSPEGEPKILDFGISQRFFADKEEHSVNTEVVPSDNRYTMAFASPEQLNKEKLSTQSDVYGLGGLLYYLISDQLPFGKNETTKEAYFENVMSGKFVLPSKATGDSKLSSRLKGDLDEICRKALKLKPADRYLSVDQMIRDVEAHQAAFPISVRRQESLYPLSRYVKRNRVALAFLGLFLTSIIGLTTYYTQSLAKQRNVAVYESQKSQQLMSFMAGIFSSSNPYENQGDTMSVGSYLDKSLLKLDTQFVDQLDTKAELLMTLGQVYNGLNNYEVGDSLLNTANQLILNNPHLPDSLLALSYYELANSKHDIGYYDEAGILVRSADSLYQIEKEKNTGAWHPVMQARMYMLMGNNHDQNGEFAAADSFFQLAYPLIKENVKAPNQELADVLLILGSVKRHLGFYDEAKKYYDECLEMQQALHTKPNSEIAITLNHFASLHFNQGEWDKAIEYGEESLKQRKQIFGKYHRETMASASNLARIYRQKGDFENAENRYLEIIDILLKIYPEPHPYHAAIYVNLANVSRNQKNYDKAIRYFDQADLVFIKIGNNHPQAQLGLLGGKGMLYLEMKNYVVAESWLKQHLEMGTKMYREDHPNLASFNFYLGKCYYLLKQKNKAIPLLEAADKIMSKFPDRFSEEQKEVRSMLAELR